MKTNRFLSLLKYELVSTLSNFFTPFFGIFFPVVMGVILTKTLGLGLDVTIQKEISLNVALTIALQIPLAMMLVSFPSSYTQEVEQRIIYRLQLFGIPESLLFSTKIILHFILLTISLIVYWTVMFSINQFTIPNAQFVFIYLLSFYALAIIYFVFSYAVSNICKKFGITYAITMSVYFLTMFLSGMMGPQPSVLPSFLKKVAFSMPTAYFSEFGKYWSTGFQGYNFAPFIQAFILIACIAGITYFANLFINRSKVS